MTAATDIHISRYLTNIIGLVQPRTVNYDGENIEQHIKAIQKHLFLYDFEENLQNIYQQYNINLPFAVFRALKGKDYIDYQTPDERKQQLLNIHSIIGKQLYENTHKAGILSIPLLKTENNTLLSLKLFVIFQEKMLQYVKKHKEEIIEQINMERRQKNSTNNKLYIKPTNLDMLISVYTDSTKNMFYTNIQHDKGDNNNTNNITYISVSDFVKNKTIKPNIDVFYIAAPNKANIARNTILVSGVRYIPNENRLTEWLKNNKYFCKFIPGYHTVEGYETKQVEVVGVPLTNALLSIIDLFDIDVSTMEDEILIEDKDGHITKKMLTQKEKQLVRYILTMLSVVIKYNILFGDSKIAEDMKAYRSDLIRVLLSKLFNKKQVVLSSFTEVYLPTYETLVKTFNLMEYLKYVIKKHSTDGFKETGALYSMQYDKASEILDNILWKQYSAYMEVISIVATISMLTLGNIMGKRIPYLTIKVAGSLPDAPGTFYKVIKLPKINFLTSLLLPAYMYHFTDGMLPRHNFLGSGFLFAKQYASAYEYIFKMQASEYYKQQQDTLPVPVKINKEGNGFIPLAPEQAMGKARIYPIIYEPDNWLMAPIGPETLFLGGDDNGVEYYKLDGAYYRENIKLQYVSYVSKEYLQGKISIQEMNNRLHLFINSFNTTLTQNNKTTQYEVQTTNINTLTTNTATNTDSHADILHQVMSSDTQKLIQTLTPHTGIHSLVKIPVIKNLFTRLKRNR